MYLLVRGPWGQARAMEPGGAWIDPGTGGAFDWGCASPACWRLAYHLLRNHLGDDQAAGERADAFARACLHHLPRAGGIVFDHQLEAFGPKKQCLKRGQGA